MNNKTLYIFAGLFAALLGVFFALQKFGPGPTDETGTYAFPSLRLRGGGAPKTEAADIVRVEILRNEEPRERLIFERTDRGWTLLNPAARVDGTIVDRMIDQVRNARKEEAADLSASLADLGLEPPRAVVTLTKKGGQEFRLNLGNQSAGKQNAVVYVNSSDVPEPMAVQRKQIDDTLRPLREYINVELLAVSELNTAFVQLEGAGHKPIFAVEKRAEDRWYFTNPAEYGEAEKESAPPPAEPPPHYEPPISGLKALMEAIGSIQPFPGAPPESVNASDADLAKFGLDNDKYATMRIEVKRTGDKLSGAQGFKQPVTEAIIIGNKLDPGEAKNQGDRYYARRADERVVVIVPGQHIAMILPVLAKFDQLQSRDLANLDRQKVDAVDVKTPDGLAKLRRCGVPETWRIFGLASPFEADQRTVRNLLDGVISRRTVTAFPPEKPDAEYGFDKPVAVVTAWQSGVLEDPEKGKKDPPDEPKLANEPVVELTFGKTVGDTTYVRRKEGKATRVLAVPASVVAKIALPPILFVNRTLPSFTLDQPIKLDLLRDGKTLTLENKAKDGAPDADWQITAPKEEAGPADARLVGDLLAELSRLSPERLAAEKPADLDTYGLKTPALQATITLRKGTSALGGRKVSYLFGKETEDKKGIFAKQGERDLVYVVNADVLKPVRADLGDRTVFHFDPAKVKEVTLSGWKKLGKGPQTLRLAKADKGWDVKESPVKDFAVNPALVDDLMGEKLARLSAEKLVIRHTGAKPNHMVDDVNQSLRISIVVDGVKDPLTLTIGALDPAEKAYFAIANTRAGDVFLLPQRAYEEILKEGPAYFKK